MYNIDENILIIYERKLANLFKPVYKLIYIKNKFVSKVFFLDYL